MTRTRTRPALALVAQRAEREIVGAPVGVMDQMASVLGVAGAAVLLGCRSLAVRTVPLRLADRGLRPAGPRRPRDARGGYAARRARHLVTENARVRAVVGALEQDRIEDVGPLFEQSHASLRDDFEVSARELDCCVDAAREVGR